MAGDGMRRPPAEHRSVGKSPGPAWVRRYRAAPQPRPEVAPRAEASAGPRTEPSPAEGPPASLIVLRSNGEDVASEVRAVRAQNPDAACLLLCPRPDFEVARTALKSGARGFVHAGMPPEQLTRAIEVASRGEMVAPRGLIEFLIRTEAPPNLDGLSARQREILGLVTEGLSNAQIARRLFLAVPTVKQHLSAAYKVLGVKNRTQAAGAFRRSNHVGADGRTPARAVRRAEP